MSGSQVAQRFGAKRIGKGKWMALCPAHADRKPSLAIVEGKRWVLLKCRSHGCDTNDILSNVGLRMSDLSYSSSSFDPAAEALARTRQRERDKRSAELRIGEWIIRFAHQGYTRKNRDEDITAICECAWVLSHKTIPHWESILRVHLERIEAADHCRRRGMLPNV